MASFIFTASSVFPASVTPSVETRRHSPVKDMQVRKFAYFHTLLHFSLFLIIILASFLQESFEFDF